MSTAAKEGGRTESVEKRWIDKAAAIRVLSDSRGIDERVNSNLEGIRRLTQLANGTLAWYGRVRYIHAIHQQRTSTNSPIRWIHRNYLQKSQRGEEGLSEVWAGRGSMFHIKEEEATQSINQTRPFRVIRLRNANHNRVCAERGWGGLQRKSFLTFVMFHDANFQLVTNGIEDEIGAVGHFEKVAHGVNAVADNQMSLQDWVCLWKITVEG